MKTDTIRRKAEAKAYFKQAVKRSIQDEVEYLAGRLGAGLSLTDSDIKQLWTLCLRYVNAQRKLRDYSHALSERAYEEG
jgi:hypothetical protein